MIRTNTLIEIRNDCLRLTFDSETGALTGLENVRTGWQAIRQPKLAVGLRLLVPTDAHRNNRVLGERQKLSGHELTDGGQGIALRWDGVVGEKSGALDIGATMTVRLEGDRVRFDLMLRNGSPYRIEEAWAPAIGGLREPARSGPLRSLTVSMVGGFKEAALGPQMPNQLGYWGADHPGFLTTSPDNGAVLPFALLQGDEEGIYIGQHHDEPGVIGFLHEFKPGYANSKHNKVTDADEIGGKPAGFVVSAIRLPFVEPGETATLPPMVLRMYEGDWHEGIRTYAEWRTGVISRKALPDWANETDAWITLHVDSPEGCARYTIDEIVDVAREAKAQGVGAMQLIGWAMGGQDGDEPYQDVNPLLGTAEELKEAVRVIEKEIGVRVLLMCKFKWADRSSAGFKEELKPLVMKDMHGDDVYFQGYAYQTFTQQLNGASRRVGSPLCHSSAEYREVAMREFRKVLALESSGILYDELTSDDRLLCFCGDHGHRYGECNSKGSVKLAEAFHEEATSGNPEFLMAGEGPNDYLSRYYGINYIRSNDGWSGWEGSHRPAWKFMDPDMKIATCLTGWDDREMVHQCIAYGYIINYEPYNFKGRLSDVPDTVVYGRAANELRRELKAYLWEGEFRDTVGVSAQRLAGEGEFIHSLFVNRATGKRAVVIGNQSEEPLRIRVGLEGGDAARYVRREIGGSPEGLRSDGTETIAPRAMIVLIEK